MFFKFPSTPYIDFSESVVRKDKVLTEIEMEQVLGREIYVEEKIDGANLGISFDSEGRLLLQNRVSYLYLPLEGQWKLLTGWLDKHESLIFDCITDEFILFGEWCYAVHSIYYNALPDFFLGFDLFEKKTGQFLSVDRRNEIMMHMGISIVPLLGKGIYTVDELKHFFGKSQYGNCDAEGIYLRQDLKGYLCYRAKMVQKKFRQEIGVHWSKGQIRCNRVMR